MKNVTITLEEDVARWARIQAARLETSVSRLVGELLRETMLRAEGYRAAEDQFFSVAPQKRREPGSALPTRDEVHDRAGLR